MGSPSYWRGLPVKVYGLRPSDHDPKKTGGEKHPADHSRSRTRDLSSINEESEPYKMTASGDWTVMKIDRNTYISWQRLSAG